MNFKTKDESENGVPLNTVFTAIKEIEKFLKIVFNEGNLSIISIESTDYEKVSITIVSSSQYHSFCVFKGGYIDYDGRNIQTKHISAIQKYTRNKKARVSITI